MAKREAKKLWFPALGYLEFVRGQGFFLTPMKLGVVRITSVKNSMKPRDDIAMQYETSRLHH